MTLVEAAILAQIAIVVAAGLWYHRASEDWVRWLASRGAFPEYAEGGLAGRANVDPVASLELLRRGPRLARDGLRQLMRRSDDDPEAEKRRRVVLRRLQVIAIAAVLSLTFPLSAWLIPHFVASLPADSIVWRILFGVGATLIIATWAARAARRTIAFGRGEPVAFRELAVPTIAVAWSLAVVAAIAFAADAL